MDDKKRIVDNLDEQMDDDIPSTSKNVAKNRPVIMDEEDEVVLQEIDVFVSKKLTNNLYILQYPLRPNDDNHKPVSENIAAQFKPKQRKLELKYDLDSTSKNYDKSRGEQIAINCASAKLENSEPIFRRYMDYQVLRSDNVSGIHSGCYAVAFYKDNALHMNPVKDIMQMKPNFFYLDAADEKTKTDARKSKEAEESSQDESDADTSTVQAVRVKFGTEETEAMKKRRVASYSHHQKMQQHEKWTRLQYKNAQEDDSYSLRDQLISSAIPEDAATGGGGGAQFTRDSKDLMRLFVPKAEYEEMSSPPPLPNNVISHDQLRQLPLSDQIEALMTNAKIIKFGHLLSQLPHGTDEQSVLKSLQNCAVLVQGCWAVKSEILYPRHAVSIRSGINGESLCRARDYCLYKFTQCTSIDRKEITNTLKIPGDDLQDILKQLSRYHRGGWQFLHQTDEIFIKNHSDIVQRQVALWDAKLQALSHQLNLRQRRISGQSFRSPGRRGRTRSGSRSASHSTDTQIFSGEDEKPDIKQLKLGGGGYRKNSPMKNGGGLPPPPLSSTTDDVIAFNNNNSSHQFSDNKELNSEFRQFLYEKLSVKPALTLTDIKRQLLLKLAESPPGSILSRGVSDLLIEQSAAELGARKILGPKMKEPVFAFAGVGSWPDVRRLLIDMLSQKQRLKFATFKEACTKLIEMPSDPDLRKILNDYCVQKNSFYSLAGT